MCILYLLKAVPNVLSTEQNHNNFQQEGLFCLNLAEFIVAEKNLTEIEEGASVIIQREFHPCILRFL